MEPGRPAVRHRGRSCCSPFVIAVIALVLAVPVVDRRRAVRHRVRARGGCAGRSRRSSTCSPRSRASSTASGAVRSSSRERSTLSRWLGTHLGFIPIFKTDEPQASSYPASTFIAGHRRRADDRADLHRGDARGVLAGAARARRKARSRSAARKWGVIRTVVLPFGRGGIIGGSMLGLGRALGETIAVTLIISPTFDPHALTHVLQTGGNSIASLIALRFSESNEFGISALDGRRPRRCSSSRWSSTRSRRSSWSRSRSGAATEI